MLFQSLPKIIFLLAHSSLARWLSLEPHSNSHSSRPLRLCRAAQRHSSFPSTESCQLQGLTHYTLPLHLAPAPPLDCEDVLYKHTYPPPTFHLAVMLWQCKSLWWCCRTVALLASPPAKYGNVGWSCERGHHDPDPSSLFLPFSSWYVCSISLLNEELRNLRNSQWY